MIVIKHGELMAEAEMEEDLQNYLKMNTYLDSADPWFWPKLRFVEGYKMDHLFQAVSVQPYLARYTLPHRRKISAIGERVFWSTQVEKYIWSSVLIHLSNNWPGVTRSLMLLQY